MSLPQALLITKLGKLQDLTFRVMSRINDYVQKIVIEELHKTVLTNVFYIMG